MRENSANKSQRKKMSQHFYKTDQETGDNFK